MTGCVIAGNVGGNGGNGGNGGAPGYNPGGPCSSAQFGSGGNAGGGGSGGGIWSVGTLIMNNCSVLQNQGGAPGTPGSGSFSGAPGKTGTGAGIAVFGVTSLTNCTFAQNYSGTNSGAGIYNGGGTLTLVACTLTANTAFSAAGIYNSSGSVSFATQSSPTTSPLIRMLRLPTSSELSLQQATTSSAAPMGAADGILDWVTLLEPSLSHDKRT